METLVLVIEIVLCLFSLFLIAVVLLQSGRSAGLQGDISGGAEAFLGKTKAKSYEGTLKKLTKIAAVGMMVLAAALVIIQVYGMPSQAGTTEASATAAPITVPTESAAANVEASSTASAISASASASAEASASASAISVSSASAAATD